MGRPTKRDVGGKARELSTSSADNTWTPRHRSVHVYVKLTLNGVGTHLNNSDSQLQTRPQRTVPHHVVIITSLPDLVVVTLGQSKKKNLFPVERPGV